MLFFRKKKVETADLSWLHTDMHSHLIPAIDDGAPDMVTSIELIKGMVALGYQKIITTPHILWELYPNTHDIIVRGYGEVQKALESEGIKVEFRVAAEYFMDEHFMEELQKKIPLLPLKDNLVLVEFSMVTAPMDLHDILFEMQMQNYQPVIAHPERYAYLGRKKEVFDELKNSGAFFQLNILSLTGHYGPVVQELSEYLLKKNYYDLAGTDLHHHRHLESFSKLHPSVINKIRSSASIRNAELLG
ncbi:MAG: tyrosine-protein phosphatase [Flavisolibacter sp.]